MEASGKARSLATDIATGEDSVTIPFKSSFVHTSLTLERAETSPGDSGVGTGMSFQEKSKVQSIKEKLVTCILLK